MSKKERMDERYIWTPKGRLSFPNLVYPLTESKYPTQIGSYNATLYIHEAEWRPKAELIESTMLWVGKEVHGSKFTLTNPAYRIPITNMNKMDDVDPTWKDHYKVVARSSRRPNNKDAVPPRLYGPTKNAAGLWDLDVVTAEEIKGGDYGLLKIFVYAYDRGPTSKGISFGLNAFQFWKHGNALGGGGALKGITTLETDIEEEGPDNISQDADHALSMI